MAISKKYAKQAVCIHLFVTKGFTSGTGLLECMHCGLVRRREEVDEYYAEIHNKEVYYHNGNRVEVEHY